MKRIFAFLLLGLRALVLHPIAALFTPPERKGKARFLSNYAAEGLLPTSAEEREQISRFGGCVNCGICDAVCPIVGAAPADEWRGPSLFALAYSRATPELVHLRRPIALLDLCGDCRLCQEACPRAVPLLEIFAYTKRKLAQVEAARAPAEGVARLPLDDSVRAAPAQPGLGA